MFPWAVVGLVVVLAGCESLNPSGAMSRRQLDEHFQLVREQEQRRKVNENWSADCRTDSVSAIRRCWVGTFSQAMNIDGNPIGPKRVAFQIYYLNERGPYLDVGPNTFPGRSPTIRIEETEPTIFNHQAPQPELVSKVRSGLYARIRYHEWPRGSDDRYVDLRGIGEALDVLDQRRAQK